MKRLFTLFFAFLLSLGAFAQPDGSEFPDFTVTDINGQTHNLYELLDQGYIVIVDVFATWCTNCIASLPALEAVWAAHGPDGDDTIRIISFEKDANTTNEATFAETHNVENPIIADGLDIISTWNVFGQPHFFVICPDRTFTHVVGNIGSNSSELLDPAEDCQSAVSVFELDQPIGLLLSSTVFNTELQFTTSELKTDYRLINLNGKEVASGISQGSTTISSVDMMSGMYLLQVRQGSQVETRRVIKE